MLFSAVYNFVIQIICQNLLHTYQVAFDSSFYAVVQVPQESAFQGLLRSSQQLLLQTVADTNVRFSILYNYYHINMQCICAVCAH
jgi:hypothetical protein